MYRSALTLLLMIASLAVARPGLAQRPVAELQADARQRFVELHERMQKLQTTLAATRPDESERLASGNRFVQERDLREAMAAVERLIENQQYDEAIARMELLREELLGLLDLLLDRDRGLSDKLDEIARLEQFREQVEKLIDEQQRERDASERSAALERHLRELAEAKAAAEALRDQQRELREGLGPEASAAEAAAAAEREARLEEQTRRLTDELRAIEEQGAKLGTRSTNSDSGRPSKSTAEASQAMGQAQDQLGQQDQTGQARDQMREAERALDEAIAEIEQLSEEARRRLQQLPFEQLAKAQQQTQDGTDKLAAEMEAAEQGQDGEGGGKPTPGRQNLQQAVPEQRAAAGQLREEKPAEAGEHQDEALDAMQAAQQELEDALTQLRQELQDEVLRALEERFIAMLGRQRELSERTRAADRLREEALTSGEGPPAQVRRRATELARGEEALAGEASDALKLLREDGSSATFPVLCEMLRDDLLELSARLDQARTGAVSQAIQADVEATLTDLIDALRREIEKRDGQGGGGGQSGGKPDLVPTSADLKLVMNKQKRVNRRTQAFELEVPVESRGGPDAIERAERLASEQATVGELLRKVADQISKQGEDNL